MKMRINAAYSRDNKSCNSGSYRLKSDHKPKGIQIISLNIILLFFISFILIINNISIIEKVSDENYLHNTINSTFEHTKRNPFNITGTYTPHPPIGIENNSQFNSTNGVSNGNGTQINPYIIEGWMINYSGIDIRNTNVYFIINNCYLLNDTTIWLNNVTNGKIKNNILYTDRYGIHLFGSSFNNYIINNSVCIKYWYTYDAISLYGVNKNTFWNNTLINGGFQIECVDKSIFSNYIHTISINNTLNGKPIYYFLNQSDIKINNTPIGQIFLINCNNSVVSNINITNATVAIEVVYSNNVNIMNSSLLCCEGIFLDHVDNSTLYNITISNILWNAIELRTSNNNLISHINLKNNIRTDYGILLINSSRNIVSESYITNSTFSMQLWEFSNSNNIKNNVIINNLNGVSFSQSMWNTFINNYIFNTTTYGISVFSDYNKFYNNTIIDSFGSSGHQAYDDSGMNFWNSSYPSGGNYWSDWISPDVKKGPNQDQTGSDGIVDSPYIIDGGAGAKDFYPLVNKVVVPEPPPPSLILLLLVVLPITFILRHNK